MEFNWYGVDHMKEFWEIGMDTFGPGEEGLQVPKFICADVMYPRSGNVGQYDLLEEARGRVDVVVLPFVLELFHWHSQLKIGATIAELSKVGTKVVGCEIRRMAKENSSNYQATEFRR